jgi:DNA-binding response OmpR family regulator
MARETILVVEDDDDIRELMRYNLVKEGFRVLEFARGEDSPLRRAYLAERADWDLFYATLAALEGALDRGDGAALDLRRKALAIIEDCRIPTERRD